jgi:methylmalonyl-CoA mutase
LSSQEDLVLAAEFPPATSAQWRVAVDRVLAGKDADLTADDLARRFERQLVTTTYDGIAVQPLYTGQDLVTEVRAAGVPGQWPFVRGSTALGGVRDGWDVRQSVELDQVAESGGDLALDHLRHGATSLLLRPDAMGSADAIAVDVDLLDATLDGVDLDLVSIALDSTLGTAGAEALLALWRQRSVDPETVRGVLGLDPIGTAASLGQAPNPTTIEDATALARMCAERWPRVCSWVVDATRYHDAGASDVEELACATATGVAYLRLLLDAGLGLAEAFGQLEFRLAATADQFATLAKLRASRRLWARVAEVLGVRDAGGQRQHVLTSRAMLTRFDPWVNLLRSTTACFAAGAGGADAITVEPHDLLVDPRAPSELGRRMARNTQLLLLEETHLGGVLDPGGGSWYVEWLTESMADRAWAWFREVEAAGGMSPALESGMIQHRIDETWTRRCDHLARRVDTLVGVSDYPNLDDQVSPSPAGSSALGSPTGAPSASRQIGLPRRRYAEAFEELRTRTDHHVRTATTRPAVLLVCLGPASAFTARVTYAKSFFETAGFRTATLDAGQALDLDESRGALARSGAMLACLCSSDRIYAEQGEPSLGVLAGSGLARSYAAARPGTLGDALLAAGADELIYTGCDVLAALDRALRSVGVQ